MKKRIFAGIMAAVMVTGALSGCGKTVDKGVTIKVGSKDFTENEIVAEVYALALEDAGYTVDRTFDISSALIHTSLINGEVELYPEYTGTGLISVLKEDPITDPEAVYKRVSETYQEQFDVTWLDYSSANDGQGLVISTAKADEYGIKTISDLQQHATELRFASQGEFDEREDGIPALEATYGPFDWADSRIYENALKYEVLASGEADVAPAYTTEGRLTEEQFTLLEDDKQVWPPYNLAPVVRNETLDSNSDIADILNKVSAAFTTENITALNARVDIDGEEYAEVAAEFYNDNVK